MQQQDRFPRVGVGVIVVKAGVVLVGRRLNSPQAGCWQLPGGKLEWGESIEACAARETLEESGVEIDEVEPVGFTNDMFDECAKHYVTLFVAARYVRGEPAVREPEKCALWRWLRWEDIPQPRFLPIDHLAAQDIDVGRIVARKSLSR